MINLASRDIAYGWGRYLLTAAGLGLLIGVTLIMAGVFRGMVDDGTALLESSGADIWVAQQYTLGPYAEPSVLHDDVARNIAGLSGVGEVGNATYLTMQVKLGEKDVRVMIAGFEQGRPGQPDQLIAGRPIMRSSYEAIADSQTGFKIGDTIQIRRHDFTVVGLTKRRVSSGGDPMVFITLKDAQQVQFLSGDGVWTWDGTTWSQLGNNSIINAAYGISLTVVNGKLYASTSGNGASGDGVWAWDGTAWNQVQNTAPKS